MSKNITKNEVLSVFDENNIGLGFITRRQVVFGFSPKGHLWCASPDLLLKRGWQGEFATREEAVKFLENLKENR